jgi:RNA polymerase sigma-70 factor (ECF subfamily)
VDPRADIAALYTRYAPMVYRRVLRFYGPQEAEEVVQEVFERALTRWHGFRGESSPSTWLYQLTTRHCINRKRDAARRRELWQEHAPGVVPQPTTAASQETLAVLQQIWDRLDDELVMIGVAYHLDGLSHADIAAQLGCSRRTVGNRLDALTRLAREHGGADE